MLGAVAERSTAALQVVSSNPEQMFRDTEHIHDTGFNTSER